MITQVLSKVRIFFAWIMIMLLPAFALADVANYTLVADYVPVVNTDSTGDTAGEVGLYDLVSGTLNLSATATPFNETEADPADITAIPNATILLDDVVASAYTYIYNGTEQTPSVTVKMGETDLEKGSDYDIVGTSSAKDVGLYTLSVVGRGTYLGEKSISWDIVPASVKAKAKSYTVNLGETAPTYKVEYEGFANNETDSVLTTAPVLACAYTTTAEEGASFDITFATEPAAKNYTFVCDSGTITVSSVYTITLDAGDGSGGSLSQYTYAYSPNEDILVTVNKPNSPVGRHVNGNSWVTTTNGVSTGTPRWTTYDKDRTPQHQLKIPAGARGDIVVKPTYGKNTVVFMYNKNLSAAWGEMTDSPTAYYLDKTVVHIKPCTYSAPGYRFVKWNTKSNGSGTSFLEDESVNVFEKEYGKDTSQTITLYAQWEQTHSDLFYENLFDVKEFSKSTSGSFHAWNTSSGKDRGTIAIDLSNNGIILSNDTNEVHIAYGMDTKYFRVQLEKDQSYTLNFKVEYLSKPAGADPDERADWTGQIYLWGVVNSGNQSYSSNNASLEKQTDGSYQLTFTPSELISNMSKCSLQLRFAVNTKGVAIKFHDIKLSKASPDPAVLTNWGAMLPIEQPLGDALVTPERAGYVFQGWKDAAGNAVTSETVMPASSLTIYSQWKQLVYVEGLVAVSRPYEYGNKNVEIDSSNAKLVDADKNVIGLTVTWPTVGTIANENVASMPGGEPTVYTVAYALELSETDNKKYELVKQDDVTVSLTRRDWEAFIEDISVPYDGDNHAPSQSQYRTTSQSAALGGNVPYWFRVDDMGEYRWEFQVPSEGPIHVPGGDYLVMLSDGSPDYNLEEGINYHNQILTSHVTITPAPLTAQATVNGHSDGSVSIFYGDPIPELGIAYTGFVNDETPETAHNFTAPTVSTDYTPDSPAGTYEVTVEGGSAGDYTITPKSTTFTVVEPIYTITMNPGEGGKVDGVNPTYQCSSEALSIRLPSTTRTGYHISVTETRVEGPSGVTFKYHAASDGEGLYYTIEIPAGTRGNITITPSWDANTYTIKYEGNPLTKNLRGFITTTGSVSDQSCYYDRDVTLQANGFSRAGYTFAGWNTQKDGTGTSYEAGEVTNNLTTKNVSTVTLYAQWTRTGYDLGYDNYFSLADFAASTNALKIADDSTAMEKGTVTADLAAGTITLTNKENAACRTAYGTKDGYYYLTLKAATQYTVSCDVTGLDDNFKWYLGVKVDGQTWGEPDAPDYQIGAQTGYTTTVTTGSQGQLHLLFCIGGIKDSSVTFSNIRVVEADRAEIAALTPTVRKLVTAGAAVGELEEPTKSGYAFLDWNTAEDGSGETYDETKTMPSASVPFFSQWVKRTAVCYATVNSSTNGTTTIALGAVCPTLGYMYVGSVEGEDPAEFETVAPTVACNYTTSSPVGIYTVTPSGTALDDYEVTCEPTSFEVIYSETKYDILMEGKKVGSYTAADTNQTFALSDYIPTREGYGVLGWTITGGTLTKGGEIAFTEGALTVPAGCYGAITLSVAGWTQSSPIVVFHLNDGSETTAEQAFTAGESAALKTLANLGFSRKNYRFKGWSKTGETGKFVLADGAETTPFAAGAATDARVDYHAIWEKIPLAFFFDANGGKALTDNARVIPQGDPMTHNANIYPSCNLGYFASVQGYISLDVSTGMFTMDTTSVSSPANYPIFSTESQDYAISNFNYNVVLSTRNVDPDNFDMTVFRIETHTETASAGSWESQMGDPSLSLEKADKDYFMNLKGRGRHPNTYEVQHFMHSFFNTEGTKKANFNWRLVCFAGRAVTSENFNPDTYVAPFEGYIECALPTLADSAAPNTGMRFVGWNTKPDGTGLTVTAETIADGENLGSEGNLTTLYAMWDADTFYWNKATSGAWNPGPAGQVDNWYAAVPGNLNWPNAEDAVVVFTNGWNFGYADATAPITVTHNADVTIRSLSIWAGQPVTFDFGGHKLIAVSEDPSATFGHGQLILGPGSDTTFKNGEYEFFTFKTLSGVNTRLTVDEGATVTIFATNAFSTTSSSENYVTVKNGGVLNISRGNEADSYMPYIGWLQGGITLDNGTIRLIGTGSGNTADRLYNLTMDNGSVLLGAKNVGTSKANRFQLRNTEIRGGSIFGVAAYVFIDAGYTVNVVDSMITNVTYLGVQSESTLMVSNSVIDSTVRMYAGRNDQKIVMNDSTISVLQFDNESSGSSTYITNCVITEGIHFQITNINHYVELVDTEVYCPKSDGRNFTHSNCVVRLIGSTTIKQESNTDFTKGGCLDYVLTEDAETREAPVSVAGFKNYCSSGFKFKIEKGDYSITGQHAFIPLVYAKALSSTMKEDSADVGWHQALTQHAEVDPDFGEAGTNWRLVTIGQTLYLELKPDTGDHYTIRFADVEEIEPNTGSISPDIYQLISENGDGLAVAITLPQTTDSTDTIKGWTVENDLADILPNMFNTKVDSKNLIHVLPRTVGNLTLTPIISSKQCKITFVANCTTYTGSMAVQQLTYTVDESMAQSLNENGFSRLGYELDSWNTAKDGSGTRYEPGQKVLSFAGMPATIKLYAQWRPTAFGLGYENLFILSDFVKSDGSFRAYSTSAENSSQGTITADLAAGSLTLENKVDSTSDEVHTANGTKEAHLSTYYWMPVTYQYYQMSFDVKKDLGADDAAFAIDVIGCTAKFGSRNVIGAITNTVSSGTQHFVLSQFRGKTDATTKLQVRFHVLAKGAKFTFSNIRIYPMAKSEIVEALTKTTDWGQTFSDTATAYTMPLPTPTRAGFTFVGWNTEPDGSGVWSDDAAFVPDATSHILYSQWTVAKPTVTTESFVYDLLEHTGVVGMPALDVAKVTNGTAKNAGTYTAIATLLDPSVAWEDGSAHGSKDDVELVWSIAPKPLSVGENNTTFNDEGFNRPNQLWQNRLYDGRNVTVKPSAYKYKGSASTAVTLVEGVDYTVTFKDKDGKVIDNPTTNMPIQGDYLTILTGIGNFTGSTQNTWSVSRPIYVWEGDASDMWAENGSWSIKSDDYTIDYFNNKWPNSRNQSAKMEEESVIDLTNDDMVYCYQFYTDGGFTGTIKNGTLYHYDTVRALGGSTLVFENMTIQGNSGRGCRVYPANADSSLMFVGNNSLTGAANLQYGTIVSNSTLAFVNGYTEALPTTGDKNIICKSATNEYTLVRNFVMTNAMLKAIAMDPGSEDDMKTKKVEFNFQFTLGELNMPNGKPMAEFTDKLRIPSGSTMSIDCSGMDAGEYPIMKAAKFFDNANIVEHTEINGVAFGLVATVVKKGSFGDKGGEIVLQLAHAYRALGNEEDTPAIGIPDSWITDFGRTPSSEHAVAEETMRLLNIPNEHGITPVQGFLMGFTAKETETIQPLAISKPTNGAITLSLCNSAAPTKPWPETPERSDAQVSYILESATMPAATEWKQESEKEQPDFMIDDLESPSHVKYYRIRLLYKVTGPTISTND